MALGPMSEATARGFRERVNALVDAIRADEPPDRSTAAWVGGLSDAHHAKLARVGLVVPRDSDEGGPVPTLGRFLEEYIGKRIAKNKDGKGEVKASTAIVYGHTRRCLVEKFGPTCPLDRITAGHCEDWRRWLATDQGLADNTIRRRCGIAKQFFRAAVRYRYLTENPFADMAGCLVRENRARDHHVTREEAAKVLEACWDAQWRLLFALSRFGGLRCPSEHLGLRWADVDLPGGKFRPYPAILVRSPKTEHHEGKGSRVVPIFPELRPYLEEVWDQAEPGSECVITRYRKGQSFGTQLRRIIEQAGLKPWPKLWHNCRATRETELAEMFPIHVVCAWIGNSAAVARRHYLQVTDDHFARAVGDAAARPPALPFPGATSCNGMQVDFQPPDGTPDSAPACTNSHPAAVYCKAEQVGDVRLGLTTSAL